jgi:cbb3-type cytochrome oxidase subunit 3
MFKNYLKGIEGIRNYPIVLLILFFIFFTVIVIYLWKSDRKYFDRMGEMPLHDSEDSNSTISTTKETVYERA